jgi:DNA-binding NarL/FixJ family response regulator
MIRVGIVDDKMINRKTVKKNLDAANAYTIVFEADNGSSFIEKMSILSESELPQIVLMDIDMPVMNGIEAIAVGTIKFPQTKFLVLTVFDDDEKIFEAIQAGASGYLLKDDSATELNAAINEILLYNGAPMSPAIARKTLQWVKNSNPLKSNINESASLILSDRELEIVKLMVDGNDYKIIAEKLFISPNTVRTHIKNIYEKLHINSRAQAVQLAYKYKWV